MASSVAGKAFVVTGTASGMGLKTATTLLARGALLGLCDMNLDGLSKLVDELGEEEKARVITRAVASIPHLTKAQFGKIDGIANLAGTAGHKLGHQEVLEMDEEEHDFIMGVDVKGVFNVLSEGLKPGFLQESGSIVHAASMVAKRGFRKALCIASVYMRGWVWSRVLPLRQLKGESDSTL